jgi:hypothetical protein
MDKQKNNIIKSIINSKKINNRPAIVYNTLLSVAKVCKIFDC